MTKVSSFALINELFLRCATERNTRIFPANLKRILKHSLSVREMFLVQKFNGEMLKTFC